MVMMDGRLCISVGITRRCRNGQKKELFGIGQRSLAQGTGLIFLDET